MSTCYNGSSKEYNFLVLSFTSSLELTALLSFSHLAFKWPFVTVEKAVNSQFNSHKSVQKIFQNLFVIFSNSLMGLNVILSNSERISEGAGNVQEPLS